MNPIHSNSFPAPSKIGCSFPRWLSTATTWRTLDDGATLTLAVAPANASFAELSYSTRHATSAASAASMPGFHPEYTTFDTHTALCHSRERVRLTPSGGKGVESDLNRVRAMAEGPVEVDRVVFYQTIGW